MGWLEPANAGPYVNYYLRYRQETYVSWFDGPQDVTVNFANITGLAARGRRLFAEPACSGSLAMSD